MSSIPLRLALLAAAFLASVPSAPAAADVLVVRSSGRSAEAYPPGRRLPDRATVTLSENDVLTILGPGGTRILRGPGTFSVTGPNRMSPLAREMTNRSRRARSRIGAVRGEGSERGFWDIDVTRAGTFCVGAGTRPILWRPDAREQALLMIDSTATEWPAGQAAIAWPEAVPVTPRAQYTLHLSTRAAPATVRLVTVAAAPTDPVDLAELLIRNGCQPQLERLLESVPPA